MSGVYLVVWDKINKEKSNVLKSTKGGYPHITLINAYGKLTADEFSFIATSIFSEVILKPITITRAYVNSFELDSGEWRHDVLLEIKEKEFIEELREKFIIIPHGAEKSKEFNIRDPHVTHKICETKEEAQEIVDDLNMYYLPYGVVIKGIMI